MKIFKEDVVCSLCGGDGVATSKDAAREYFGGDLFHKNPRVCKENLERKERKKSPGEPQ